MEPYIPISFLNDFIFCPRSIYFHQLYGRSDESLYHSTDQSEGKAAHATVDAKTYTTAKKVLQTIEIYSQTYGLGGKIDTFDTQTGILTERKKKIKVIYDGYIYQLYAQMITRFILLHCQVKTKRVRVLLNHCCNKFAVLI
ncbi:MAG: type V CRISPR-associated protein Cas4 [Campylobacterales bacterium]|nr:type V CRISPR-associated protein Cas4 [Campylobacterales bacterium]